MKLLMLFQRLRTHLTIFWIFQHIRLTRQDICMNLTSSCPSSKELWSKRAKTFNCSEKGTSYTCLLNKDHRLIETCIYEFSVDKGIAGCPFIIACQGVHPQLATENNYVKCPDENSGCPEEDHEPYTIYEMYKYPACLPSLQFTSTVSSPLVSSTSNVNHVILYNTSASIVLAVCITVAVTLTLVFSFYMLIKCCRRSRYRRDASNIRESVELDDLLANDKDEKYPSTSTQDISKSSGEKYFEELKHRLWRISERAVKNIPLSPIQMYPKLPIELLFAKVNLVSHLHSGARGNLEGISLLQSLFGLNINKEIKGPNDLFFKNGEAAKIIFMKGDAACGKTTYCLWLLNHWLNTQQDRKNKAQQNEWEHYLGKFELVFFIRLREVNKSRINIIDMICHDILKLDDNEYIEWVKKVMKTGLYHCLIIIDGLDEWKPDDNVTNNDKFSGMPIFNDIENCVIFITMRPWKFNCAIYFEKPDDQITEILGLNDAGIQETTANVLKNHYGMDVETTAGKETYDEIMRRTKIDSFRPLMKVPLLAVVCIQIWLKRETVGKSLTRFYIEMISMLIDRAQEKHEIGTIQDTAVPKSQLSESLKKYPSIARYMSVLSKLGKLAYDRLMSCEYTFEISSATLLTELVMTESELEFSLNVGLLRMEELDSTLQSKVKVYFFHKSVQEFLCAAHIDGNKKVRKMLLKSLSDLNAILELGNVLKFLSGLNPMFASKMSKHILDVMNGDAKVCEYRKFNSPLLHDELVGQMYELLVGCYKEMTCLSKGTFNRSNPYPFHVSDIDLNAKTDKEVVRVSSDILKEHYHDIRSLSICAPTDSETGISDSILTQFLDQTKTLESLDVIGAHTNRTLNKISARFSSLSALSLMEITLRPDIVDKLNSALLSNRNIETLGLQYTKVSIDEGQVTSLSGILQILPQLQRLSTLRIQLSNEAEKPIFLGVLDKLSHLKNIEYNSVFPDDREYDIDVLQIICKWTGLHGLCLGNIDMTDKGLELSSLETLRSFHLYNVTMSKFYWRALAQTISSFPDLETRLYNTNIDEETFSRLPSNCVVYRITAHAQ